MSNGDPFNFLDDTPTATDTAPTTKRKRSKPANFSDTFGNLMDRHGFHYGLVERTVQGSRWNPETQTREVMAAASKRDLFGFADYVALHRDLPGTTYVQVCRVSDMTTRLKSACTHDASELPGRKGKKPQTNENRVAVLTDLLLAGNRFWIVGFEKGDPKHGQRADRWYSTVVDVTLDVLRMVQSGERVTVAKLPKVVLS